MDESDFEGTLVLEMLAEINKADDFFMAIDLDDFGKAKSLMKQAKIDSETITRILRKMNATDGDHSFSAADSNVLISSIKYRP